MTMPASVFRLFAGRAGGGESSGCCSTENRGASGSARGGDGVRWTGPLATYGGVSWTGETSKPGGRTGDGTARRDEGARISMAWRAPSLRELAEPADSWTCASTPSPLDSSKNGEHNPLNVGEDGHTAEGDDGGSGVAGGVSAALERRLLAAGAAERARGLPRRTGGKSSSEASRATMVPTSSPEPASTAASPVPVTPGSGKSSSSARRVWAARRGRPRRYGRDTWRRRGDLGETRLEKI